MINGPDQGQGLVTVRTIFILTPPSLAVVLLTEPKSHTHCHLPFYFAAHKPILGGANHQLFITG